MVTKMKQAYMTLMLMMLIITVTQLTHASADQQFVDKALKSLFRVKRSPEDDIKVIYMPQEKLVRERRDEYDRRYDCRCG